MLGKSLQSCLQKKIGFDFNLHSPQASSFKHKSCINYLASSSYLYLLQVQSIVHCYTTHIQQAPGGEEWEEWGQMEEFSVKVEPSSHSQQTPLDEDLFHDMTPVFQKPKKVRLYTHAYILLLLVCE